MDAKITPQGLLTTYSSCFIILWWGIQISSKRKWLLYNWDYSLEKRFGSHHSFIQSVLGRVLNAVGHMPRHSIDACHYHANKVVTTSISWWVIARALSMFKRRKGLRCLLCRCGSICVGTNILSNKSIRGVNKLRYLPMLVPQTSIRILFFQCPHPQEIPAGVEHAAYWLTCVSSHNSKEARQQVKICPLQVAPQYFTSPNPLYPFGSSRGLGVLHEIKNFIEVLYRIRLGHCHHDMSSTLHSKPLRDVCLNTLA